MSSRRILLGAILLWCLGILVTPFLHEAGPAGREAAVVLTAWYGHVCHQFDSRSFHADGEKFPVCARCMSIYLAFFTGALVVPLLRRSRRPLPVRTILAVAVAPMVIDVLLDAAGLHGSNYTTRAISGAWFGLLSAIPLTPDFEEAVALLRTSLTFHKPSATYEAKT